MKAFLLAAGHGTRLRPLTDRLPKCLVPIRGVPLLNIWLDVCRRAGIDELLVNLHKHADLVRNLLRSDGHGMRVQLVEEPVLLGSAGTLLANREWVSKEASFWVLYADVLTNADLGKMLSFHNGHNGIVTIGAYQVDNPSRCGVVTFDRELVVREFEEKPIQARSNWAFSGVMIARPEVMEMIPQRSPSDLGFDVLPRLVGRMSAYLISDYLLDIGTMENYQRAQTNWPGLAGQKIVSDLTQLA